MWFPNQTYSFFPPTWEENLMILLTNFYLLWQAYTAHGFSINEIFGTAVFKTDQNPASIIIQLCIVIT